MTKNLPAEHKPQIVAGGPVAALVPQDIDQAFRVASAIALSGLAPRGMDRPEQVMIAIMAGAELGLAPFQAVQSFAIVNNRPTLWGDGLMAVVRARGVKVKEWLEGDGESMVAHCRITRPDTGEEVERPYSVADAKKAGLWGKAGPWQQHPKRMLQMRARAFALRDGCADMLRGVQIREEVEDYQHVRDVTPRPSGLRERLGGPAPGDEGFSQHHAAPAEPVDFAEQAEEIAHDPETGEVIDSAEISHLVAGGDGDRVDQRAAQIIGDAPDEEPDDDFPGDQPAAGGFGATTADKPAAVVWGETVKADLEAGAFATVAAIDAFTGNLDNGRRFGELAEADAEFAKRLNAQIKGTRKALYDRERAR